MKSRRTFLLSLVCMSVALAVVIGSTLADELIGRITKVNTDSKKIVVTEKGSDKEIDVTITDDTVFVNRKGEEQKVDLEKLEKGVEKSKKGIYATITHEKGVASKIRVAAKKGEPKKDEAK